MGKLMKYICLGYLLFFLIFLLVSTLTDNWLKSSDQNIGLWNECSNTMGCHEMERSPAYDVAFLDWFTAVRSFMVLSCIFDCLGIILLLCNICFDEYFRLQPVRVLMIFDVVFLIFAIIVFAVEKRLVFDSEWSLDWSFYIAILDLILSIIGVILLYLTKDERPKKSPTGFQPANSYIPVTSTAPNQQSSFQSRENGMSKQMESPSTNDNVVLYPESNKQPIMEHNNGFLKGRLSELPEASGASPRYSDIFDKKSEQKYSSESESESGSDSGTEMSGAFV